MVNAVFYTEEDVMSQGKVVGETSLSTQIRYEGGIEAIKKANLTWGDEPLVFRILSETQPKVIFLLVLSFLF